MAIQSDDIMRALGRLEEGVQRLREDFEDEKDAAHESRAVIHRRLDEHVHAISELRGDVSIGIKVDAQVRNDLQELKATVDANQTAVAPSIAEWRRMKAIGIGLAGLLALGGISIGAMLAYMGDIAVTAIRHWLKIN